MASYHLHGFWGFQLWSFYFQCLPSPRIRQVQVSKWCSVNQSIKNNWFFCFYLLNIIYQNPKSSISYSQLSVVGIGRSWPRYNCLSLEKLICFMKLDLFQICFHFSSGIQAGVFKYLRSEIIADLYSCVKWIELISKFFDVLPLKSERFPRQTK